jgi:transcriptional regulator with XRE-family HTH domain
MAGMGNQIKGMGNDLVREARRRVGWTQARLAEEAGTTQSAIARLESGRTSPAFDDVIRLLRIMGLDLDFMLVERDDSDWIQAQRMLHLTPPQRHTEHVTWSQAVERMRRDAARSVA